MTKRLLCLACLLAGVASLSAQAQRAVNPILPHADPFITPKPVGGKYLLLATTGRNITLWSGPTPPTAATDAAVVFQAPAGLSEIWSPTLWRIDGRWWIYFTARAESQEHGIYALESDTADALGSYTFRGQIALGRPAIDPSLLVLGTARYLMYVAIDHGENSIHMVRLAAPMAPTGTDALLSEPEYPWERGEGSTRNYPVNEGPTALYHHGQIFVVYSASDTASPLYCLGLLHFAGGDPLVRRHWVKLPHPVFSAAPANGIYGPGRGTFAHARDGTDWLLYAAKRTNAPTAAGRAIRAQRFTWNADRSPNFGVPQKDGPI